MTAPNDSTTAERPASGRTLGAAIDDQATGETGGEPEAKPPAQPDAQPPAQPDAQPEAQPDAQPEADDRASAIGRAAGRGLRWSVAGTALMKVVSFGMSLVLAYLLDPADYGSFAIALAACQFVMHVNDMGLIAAVVQWRGRFETMAPTATTLAIGFSAVVYGAFWIAAPWFAALAGNPSAAGLVRLLTLTIVVDGITAVRSASLMRNFQQDRLMIANGVGFVATFGCSIGLAVGGSGAYALVYGQLAGVAVTGVLVLVLAQVPIRFGLDRQVAAKLMRFGLPLAASLGVEALLLNADYVIVGRLLGVTALGFYLLAFNTSSWAITMIGTAIRYVSIPAFARLSDQQPAADTSTAGGASGRRRRPRQPESLSDGVRRSVVLLVSGVLPVVILISLLAPELVAVLYGPKWEPAAPVLRLLMVLTAARMFASLVVDALAGIGATHRVLWVNLAWAAVLVPALYVGTSVGGIRGTATAHILVGLAVAVPLSVAALLFAGVRLGPLPRALARPFVAGLLTVAVTLLVDRALGNALDVVRLATAGLAGLLCYTAIAVPRSQVRQLRARLRRGRGPTGPA